MGRSDGRAPGGRVNVGTCAERYAAQRRRGFSYLVFEPSIEHEFRGALTQMSGQRLRFALPVAILADLGIVLVDLMLAQPLMTGAVRMLMLGLLLPLTAMMVWFHAPDGDWGRRPRALSLLVLSIHLIIAAAVHEARSALPEYPYESYLMVGLFSYFLSGLMFWWALGVGLISIACFVASSLVLGGVSPYELLFLSLLHVAGAIGLYFYEHQQRQAFLLARELRWKADMDPLSGLMNHGATKQHLQRAWAMSVRDRCNIGLLMIDIDHFKQVNDGYGHEVGDRVIRALGSVLQDHLRRPLDAAGRLGGDEFVAMWFDVDPDWLVLQAAKIRQQLTRVVGPLGVSEERITLSIGGICVQAEARTPLDRLMQQADSMLYQVKRDGRDGQRIVDQVGGQEPDCLGHKVVVAHAHG